MPAEMIKAQFTMRSINLLFLFAIRRNCPRSGWSRTLYLFKRRAIKQIVEIIGAYHFCNYVQNFIQHSPIKVNAIYRGNYWGLSRWILMQQVNYRSYILYSSYT